MIIHACDLCGSDIVGYATWIEVPVNIEHPRIPMSQGATILHLKAYNGKGDVDICAACFRDALRRYLVESTLPTANEVLGILKDTSNG